MTNLIKKFQKILLVEIEDLHDDLDLFIQVVVDRHQNRQITDYVYAENIAILRNEVLGLEDCIRGCADLDPGSIASADDLAEFLKVRFKKRLDAHGYVPALYTLLAKRIEKIATYLRLEEAARAADALEQKKHQSPVQFAG
ncbi:MAG TPA: hypothetical protein VMW87_08255 [Spirochaetia bacterium]|nr:hypothetical protein [Spirochaetia bacterium]